MHSRTEWGLCFAYGLIEEGNEKVDGITQGMVCISEKTAKALLALPLSTVVLLSALLSVRSMFYFLFFLVGQSCLCSVYLDDACPLQPSD